MNAPFVRIAVASAVVTLCSAPVSSQEAADRLREVRWHELHDQGLLPAGEIVPQDGPYRNVLKIRHDGPGPALITLAEIEEPGITGQQYAVSGQVRYENVEGSGFLEMLNHFPSGQWFFSRTLANSGPMQSLSGTATWRDFLLPFLLEGNPQKPNRLVINLHLEGPGTVYLTDLTLAHLPGDWSVAAAPDAWWGDRTGGIIGGTLGSLLGLIGAVVGLLAGLGRGRSAAQAMLWITAVLGTVSLALALAALVLSQPYAVWYPLLLIGVLGLVFGLGGMPFLRLRFQQTELRRMQALDSGP
jgi:hypothetical protein